MAGCVFVALPCCAGSILGAGIGVTVGLLVPPIISLPIAASVLVLTVVAVFVYKTFFENEDKLGGGGEPDWEAITKQALCYPFLGCFGIVCILCAGIIWGSEDGDWTVLD